MDQEEILAIIEEMIAKQDKVIKWDEKTNRLSLIELGVEYGRKRALEDLLRKIIKIERAQKDNHEMVRSNNHRSGSDIYRIRL